jgi:hypothetical protein
MICQVIFYAVGKILLISENCALLGYYAASSGNFLPMFWDNLSVHFVGFKNNKKKPVASILSGFGGLGVSALAFGTQVRGFKPGRSRRIFQGEKFLSA